MRQLRITVCLLFVFHSALRAQDFFTLGIGFSGALYSSKDLDRFTDTYNLMNNPFLASNMKGLGEAVGFRWELGYRHIGPLGAAFLIGTQNYISNDAAQYQNGAARTLELEINSMYFDCEIGHTHNNYFVNGDVIVFFNRRVVLASNYSRRASDMENNPLNGTYHSKTSVSADVGIAIGVVKEPFILTGKLTYPVFTGGGSNVLKDETAEKIATGTDVFPSDYVTYCFDKDYDGVASNIDGIKIFVTLAVAISLRKK